MYCVPKELLQLSVNAAESRRRTESLYNSAATPEPLPVKLSVSSRQRIGNSATATGTHQLNGNVSDSSTHQRHATSQAASGTSSRGDVMKLSDGEDDREMISGRSEPMHVISGGAGIQGGGCEQPLTASPCGQLSTGSLIQKGGSVCQKNDGVVLIAAGHETTRLAEQKAHRNDRSSPHGATSPVNQRLKADGHSTHNRSGSDGLRRQPYWFTGAAVSAPCSSRHAKAHQRSSVKQSSEIIADQLNDSCPQPRCSSSSSVVTATTHRTEADEDPASSSGDSLRPDCDSLSSPAADCDIIVPPQYNDGLNVAAVGQTGAVSPTHSDPGEVGSVGGRADTIQPRQSNGVGRGQILFSMFSGNRC